MPHSGCPEEERLQAHDWVLRFLWPAHCLIPTVMGHVDPSTTSRFYADIDLKPIKDLYRGEADKGKPKKTKSAKKAKTAPIIGVVRDKAA